MSNSNIRSNSSLVQKTNYPGNNSIPDNSVGTSKLQDLAVTDAKLNSTTLTNIKEMFKDGMQGMVDETSTLTATTTTGTPTAGTFYSSITNRSAIPDISSDLKMSFGIERIMTQSIYQLQNEFGPNGEPVWGVVNDTRGLIRFVGNCQSYNDATGQGTNLLDTSAYIEVTFYGTGINALMYMFAAANITNYSVDGGATFPFTSNTSTTSGVLTARNYSSDQVIPITSSLPLGWHTVKISISTLATSPKFYGFEILNTSSTTSININKGHGYKDGSKLSLLANASSAYNSGFESGTLGTRGGRVLTYLKTDGTLGKSITPTNASQANLTSADHTNEEVARTYHYSEFGAGRADDFSRIITGAAASNYAFTLDDGTTSLLGSSVGIYNIGQTGVGFSASGFITLTFVGTGLDIVDYTATIAGQSASVTVDGTSIGTFAQIVGLKTRKIVSGLPYGTHTVKITSTNLNDYVITKFIVYQPKTPSLPTGALELGAYNIMADYASGIVSGNIDALSTGVISKQSIRELVYVGTWSLTSPNPGTFGGAYTLSSTSGSYFEYSFFGTGLNIIAAGGTSTIQIDGSNYTGSATAVGTGSSWTPGTSTWVGASVNGAGLIITGLTLGLHKVRVTLSAATNFFMHALHVITPIHSHKSNLYADYQNTLSVGSCSLSDNRSTSLVKDIPVKKAWAQAVGITSGPTTNQTGYIPMPDMSLVIKTTTGLLQISYSANVVVSSSPGFHVQAYVDGVAVGVPKQTYLALGYAGTLSDSFMVQVSPGVHKVDLYWGAETAAVITANGTNRSLTVKEEV